jgi:hypothetical protein
MQLRISWQLLAAVLIFLISLCVIGRTLVSTYQAYQAPPPTSIAVFEATATEAAPALTATSDATASPPSATRAPAEPTATAEASPSPQPASPTPEPSATLAPTLPPPSATPFIPPTPTATPAPLAVQLSGQGFSQSSEAFSYAFVLSNPNPDLAVQQTRFQIAAYDASGIVVKTAAGEVKLIGPAQSAAVAGLLEIPANFQISRLDILLRDGLFVRSGPLPPFVVENLALVPGTEPIITGIVRNPYDRDFEELPVVGVVYDESGAIIGGGNGVVLFIPALGQAPVEVPFSTSGTPARLALFPLLLELVVPTPRP